MLGSRKLVELLTTPKLELRGEGTMAPTISNFEEGSSNHSFVTYDLRS